MSLTSVSFHILERPVLTQHSYRLPVHFLKPWDPDGSSLGIFPPPILEYLCFFMTYH